MKSTLDSAMALHKSLLESATKNNASVNFLENMKSQGRSPQEQSSNAFLSGMQAADQEKYDRVRDWLMDVNQKATEKRMVYENRMLAQQSITPQIMAYMQSATQMDPVTRKMFAQQIMEDWNRDTGEQGQVLAIDATNPFLVTLQGPQGTQLVDLRAMVRDDPIMQRELAMQMPAYLEQQRYDRNMDQQQLGLKQQHLNLEREKLDLARNPQQQARDPKKEAYLWDQLEKSSEAEREWKLYNDAEQLLHQSDDITMTAGEQMGDKWSPVWRKNPNQQQLATIGSQLRGLEFKRSGYRNETEFENIQVVDPHLTKEANLKIIEQKKKQLEPFIQQKTALEQQLGLTAPQTPQATPMGAETQAMVKVQWPDQTVGMIPKEYLQQAINEDGAQVVQ